MALAFESDKENRLRKLQPGELGPGLLKQGNVRIGVFPEGQEVLAKRFARMLPLITNTQAEIELGQVRATNSAPRKKRRGL